MIVMQQGHWSVFTKYDSNETKATSSFSPVSQTTLRIFIALPRLSAPNQINTLQKCFCHSECGEATSFEAQ